MKHLTRSSQILLLTTFLICVPLVFAAPKESVLHVFTGPDGANPWGNLTRDPSGNLFGTTATGGAYNGGTVFELMPGKNGTWKQKVLHSFTGGYDGYVPYSGLIFDSAGILYGTTAYGGGGGCDGGCGTVYKLSANSQGQWKEDVLHIFNGADGSNPTGNLIMDPSDNLFGTTEGGGHFGGGTVFMLAPVNGQRYWKETLLHNFTGVNDGNRPFAGVVFDPLGNLYGSTVDGAGQSGTVFKLSPLKSGKWKETILYLSETAGPIYGGILVDNAGDLFDTTFYGGTGFGQVFELTPSRRGYKEITVYLFCDGTCSGGAFPYSGLIIDKTGNLYGTTGGGNNVNGAVYKLTHTKEGWSETELHSFAGGADGSNPISGVTIDPSGNLYGTTAYGGNTLCTNNEGCGIVFRISP